MPYNEKSLENLEKGNKITSTEQARILGSKGGKVAQANRKARKREQEEWAELLSLAMDSGEAEDISHLKEAKSKNLTVSKAMKVKLITEALKGNLKAYECIMRYAGAEEKEDDEQEQNNGEATTDNSFIKALNTRAEELWANETTDTEENKTE